MVNQLSKVEMHYSVSRLRGSIVITKIIKDAEITTVEIAKAATEREAKCILAVCRIQDKAGLLYRGTGQILDH